MNQPELYTRVALAQIEANKPDYVTIPGRRGRIKIGFLHDYTIQKITELLLKREELEESAKEGDVNDVMRSAVKHPYFSIKMAALAVLNSPFKIALFYPLKWRWWAFVRKFNEVQVASVTMAIQKKNNIVLGDVLSHYRVLEGYEDGYDEDDKGRSRAIPSRTHTGMMASFVKEFPCYGDTRWIPFVGRIVNYTARCVLTIQQVQLMQSDLPHTLLNHKKDTGKGAPGTAPRVRADDPAFELQQKAVEKALARRRAKAEGREPYTVDELFRKQ